MLAPPTLYILIGVLLLLVVGLIFLYLAISRAQRQASQKTAEVEMVADDEGADDQADELSSYASSVGLRRSFSRGAKRSSAYTSGKGARYRVPWYLMIGEAQSGKTTLLGNAGLTLMYDVPKEKTGGKQAVNWFFFDQGTVLDVAGDFVLRADGETSDGNGWHNLTRLLKRYRPERPLDGIILTIPASDLLGGPNLSVERKLKLEQKAHRLYKKLLAAQKTLGMNFPVYVLVTKCDRVTGFKSLCAEIPDRRNEIFGWSSPYTREIAYRTEWVTEAFQNLYRYLFQLQIEVFAQRDEVRNSDELFMLPSEMRSMRVPLQLYLDHIFKESAYHDSFFLRGIYFCGDSNPAIDAPDASLAHSATEPEIDWLMPPPNPTRVVVPEQAKAAAVRRPAFVAHLFERKIFQEEMLARPINRTMLSRNRTVLVAQLLSLLIPLVGVIGILLTYPGLQEREGAFYKFLRIEEDDLRAIKAQRETGVKDENWHSREARLFDAMSNLDGKGLSSIFIPTSWFSDINERSGQSISSAYQYIIFESMRRELDCRTESRLQPLPSSAPCYATLASNPEQEAKLLNGCDFTDPAAVPVSAFIESLGELIQNRALYHKIVKENSGDPNDLSRLLVYLGHAPLPAKFDTRNNLFAQALRTTVGVPLQTSDANVYDRGECKVKGMIQEIYDKTFRNKSVSYGYLSDITKAEALLNRQENSWLATRSFDDERAAFYGRTISSAVHELKRALNDLSNQKFMPKAAEADTPDTRTDAEEPLRQHAARQVILWDTESLQQAVELYKEYAAFVGRANYQNPNTLNYKVKEAALNAFVGKLDLLVRRARRVQPAQRAVGESATMTGLDTEIASFKRAQTLLAQLLEICDTLGIDVGLRRALSMQTNALMRTINKQFTAEDFYATGQWDFSRWQMDQPFQSYMLFGASSADELETYLADQRNGISGLGSQYAEPILNFMLAQGIQLQPTSRALNWNSMLGQLDKYDNQKPGNTVAVLENFIRTDMNKVSLDNCSAMLSDSTAQYGDYFLQVRNSLRQLLYQRCEQLAGVRIALIEQRAREQMENEFYESLKSYNRIEQSFNNTLAGRFPFSDVPQTEPFAEADPESINAFFKVLQDNKATALTALGQCPQYGISPKAALDFLNDMEQVQLFFASFLQKKPLYPLYDFNLKFRVNEPKSGPEPNPIIDWEFAVGKKKFRYQEEAITGNWGYTDPLTLTLRWAKDAPTIPLPKDSALPRLKVNEKTVTMTYSNNWSLLLLLLKNKGAGSDFEQGVDIEPYTLKFEVPTAPNPALPNPILQAQPARLVTPAVVVYIRLSLVAPSQKDPLIVPEKFPRSAPQLTNRATRSRYQSSEQE